MSRTLELPESVYEALVEEARASGLAPADWIASKLSRGSEDAGPSTELERLLRHAGSIDLGRPTGTDNEGIDADLAREYSDSHEDAS